MDDFLIEIEYAGLHSRIKRLSDALLYSTRDFYKSEGLDIEPNWNLVFLLLQKQGTMTITEISEKLQFSHPAVVKIINKMKKKGYIDTQTDEEDSRKQLLSLSQKALDKLPVFEMYWEAGIKTTKDLLDDSPDFVEQLKNIEEKLNRENYKERTLRNLTNK
ncbi:MarR family winged helix-turn-helix transcriptional regulator [Sinomicrobium pectinilyticum]|nr:MarR family transcriptional regulator [Sinomicrobium pectinilyticum]